jgi:hypothetical protein
MRSKIAFKGSSSLNFVRSWSSLPWQRRSPQHGAVIGGRARNEGGASQECGISQTAGEGSIQRNATVDIHTRVLPTRQSKQNKVLNRSDYNLGQIMPRKKIQVREVHI